MSHFTKVETDDPSVCSMRRYAILRGWARYLCLSEDITRESDRIRRKRGKDFGILVDDDPWALSYQRLYFKTQRAKYAVGMRGLVSMSTYTDGRFQLHPQSEVDEYNRNWMNEDRMRAHRAKKLIEEKYTQFFEQDECDEYEKQYISELHDNLSW